MAPAWLAREDPDEALRELQLRWFRDDLWMRRVVFGLAVAAVVGLLFAILLLPQHAVRLASILGSISVPSLAYYFGRRGRAKGDEVSGPPKRRGAAGHG